MVAAGGPGDASDGVVLGCEGLALAVGAPVGPGGQPLPRATDSDPTMAPTGRLRGAWQANTSSGQVSSEPMP